MQLKIFNRIKSLVFKGVVFMRIGLNSVITIICSILWLSCISYAAPNNVLADNHLKSGTAELTPESDKVPKAFLPVTKWEFEPVIDGQEVVHEFAIQNKGNAPLNVERVKTG
jgi:hypothetical protein